VLAERFAAQLSRRPDDVHTMSAAYTQPDQTAAAAAAPVLCNNHTLWRLCSEARLAGV